jgi:predicted ArsR family transcriptional regulator
MSATATPVAPSQTAVKATKKPRNTKVERIVLPLVKEHGPLTRKDMERLSGEKVQQLYIDLAKTEGLIEACDTRRHPAKEGATAEYGRGRPEKVYKLSKKGRDKARRLAERAAKLAQAEAQADAE